MVLAKKFIVAKIFEGEIQEDDFMLEEEELPPITDGEFLVEALYLSVDPFMRVLANTYKIGQVLIGIQAAKIIESKNSEYPVGKVVVASLGCRTDTIIKNPADYNQFYILPDIGDLPISLSVGILGRPGNSAYWGFLEICKPKEGETVVITGAAGAVGSHVGQIAKIKGCTVIGITGSDEKAKWLKSIGFDHVINYRKVENLAEELKQVAPNGIDCYFDNVGGETSSIIIRQMNKYGRISVCGSISSYNELSPPKATIIQTHFWQNYLEMKGFRVDQFRDLWLEGIQHNLKWVQEGKLKYRETITDGFENMPRALIGIMKGENIGKALVRVKGTNIESQPIGFRNILNKFKELGG